jgi:hypothetical protein
MEDSLDPRVPLLLERDTLWRPIDKLLPAQEPRQVCAGRQLFEGAWGAGPTEVLRPQEIDAEEHCFIGHQCR